MANFAYSALEVLVTAQTRGMESQIKDSATKAGEEAGKQVSGRMARGLSAVAPIAGKVGKAAATGLGLATTAAVAFGVKAVEAGEAANKINAQTAAVIKSTGGAANVTAAQVKGLASAISLQTGISGGAVKAGQNMLLTFRGVANEQGKGNDVFNQSTRVLTDMTAAMTGGNVTQEAMRTKAIMLGKALNDPIKGTTALARVGVQFTDQQKKQITALTESGHKLQAQKIILGELRKEFGGSAAAMATPTQRLTTAFRSMQVTLGQTLIKAVDPMVGGVVKLAQSLQGALGPGGKLAPLINAVGVAAGKVIAPLSSLIDLGARWVDRLKPSTINAVVAAIERFGPALAGVGAAAAVFTGSGLIGELPLVGPMLSNLMGPLNAVKGQLISVGKAAAVQLIPSLESTVGEVGGLGGALGGMAAPVGIAVAGFATLMAVSPQFRQAIMQIVAALGRALQPVLRALGRVALQLVPPLIRVARVLGSSLAVALRALIPLINAFATVLRWISPALGPLVIAMTALWTASKLYNAVLLVQIAIQKENVVATFAMAVAQRAVQVATVAMTAAQWLLNAALDANPIGIVVVALAALTAAFVIAWTHSATFRKIVIGAWHGVLDAAKAVWNWIKANWPLLVGMLGGPLGVAAALVIKHWGAIKAATQATWRWISDFIHQIIAGIRLYVTSQMTAIRGIITRAWNAIKATVTTVLNAVRALIVGSFNADKRVIEAAMSTIRSVLSAGWSAVRNLTSGAVTAIRHTVSEGFSAARQSVSSAMGSIRSLLSGGFDAARRTVSSGVSSMLGSIAHLAAGFLSGGRTAIANLLRGISGAMSGIDNWVKGKVVDPIVNAVKHFFGIHSPSDVMAGVGENVTAGFVQGIVRTNPLTVARHVFGGIPAALGSIVSKGLVSLESLPGKALKALGGLGGKIKGLFGKIGGLFGGGSGGGVAQWSGLMHAVLAHFGIPDLFNTFMTQMQTESGGNPRAINLWDSNAKAGIPSQGLMQVIPPTFAEYAGPYRSRGIMDPLANIYAAVAYAVSRYGASIGSVLGHGHGYAKGGVVHEPVTGFGHFSGELYRFAERGAELISPLTGPHAAPDIKARVSVVINVYPQKGQSETEIAAAVSRRLSWAIATGKA